MTIKAPSTNTVEMIDVLKKTVVALIQKNPSSTIEQLYKGCEKKLGIKPIRFHKSFVEMACKSHNVKWSPK